MPLWVLRLQALTSLACTVAVNSVLLQQTLRTRPLSAKPFSYYSHCNASYGANDTISTASSKTILAPIVQFTGLSDDADNCEWEWPRWIPPETEHNLVEGLEDILVSSRRVTQTSLSLRKSHRRLDDVQNWEADESDNPKRLRGFPINPIAFRANLARTLFILVSLVLCLFAPAAFGTFRSASTVNNADQVARKATDLVPGWEGLCSCKVEQLRGASKMVFKLTRSDSQTCCVRVLRPGRDPKLVHITSALARADLVPEMIGASSVALVQRFIDGRWPAGLQAADDHESNAQASSRLGRFVAKFHNTVLDVDSACDKRDLCVIARSAVPDKAAELQEEVQRLFRDLPHDESELVLTHGDLHYGNILESSERLWAIDLESVALRPAVTDIAYLFISSSMASDSKSYPGLAARRQFAKAYLEERGKSHDADNVDRFLFAVECEWPFQFFRQACLLILAVPSRKQFAATMLQQVPRARECLGQALADPSRQPAVVEYGVGKLTAMI